MSTVALITGAASGIGAAVARRLSAGGARCVLVDLDGEGAERVAKETGGVALAADVSTEEANRAAVELAERRFGRLDVVHLNAGVVAGVDLGAFDAARYRTAMGVNVDGVVFGVVAALPLLRRSGGGAIVVTSSLAGLVGYDGDPVYTMTKHAVVGLVRALAVPLAAEGVRVSAVCPGFTDTPLVAGARETFVNAGFPLLTAEDVAAAVESACYADPGTLLIVQPGRQPVPYRYAGVPGPAGGERPPTP
ncbi:SDR family NAD(P)-dependent oxidoreductase [Nonomuraea roseoviolacea subsp. roseoviolacea]|uniref:NAD(P)-dependent dehydrogenase (Short-subunit alcohol dehydrogenase family) n=1 Tax=Nonomuraea roseoviolacea subsp. carminata TaxID=160689 RepID=A0ABT1K5B4_9ACTN|nr:SDR family oxidoreductase [Nonomuraea roseoviolacea]MCP2349193.1 NAD(P)-dependent dehydrogenase (short-subunit alcohol dehydrogenase family) [Nonomuraea roseoviolacea subsp. carminata]